MSIFNIYCVPEVKASLKPSIHAGSLEVVEERVTINEETS
jgi:hypothetical protein